MLYYRGWLRSELEYIAVLEAVTLALANAFPNSNIFADEVEQSLNLKDFIVTMPQLDNKKQLGQRFARTAAFDVIYFAEKSNEECYAIAQQLDGILASVKTPGGDVLHAKNSNATIDNRILHYMVQYPHHIYTTQQIDEMETLTFTQEV